MTTTKNAANAATPANKSSEPVKVATLTLAEITAKKAELAEMQAQLKVLKDAEKALKAEEKANAAAEKAILAQQINGLFSKSGFVVNLRRNDPKDSDPKGSKWLQIANEIGEDGKAVDPKVDAIYKAIASYLAS